ncbi:MAG TPA: CoA transferase [Dehalococcoidia bacterium]|nr:CoA transferase [Dehalococcoidia bacterium]
MPKSTPLSNSRIADLTNVIAGPVATRILGHMGAEILKVELPWGRAIGNIAMHGEDEEGRAYNKVGTFNEVNRAKKSIAIDLTHATGKEVFKEIVNVSDIVIQNYSPRVMGNLGLTYEDLRAVKPDIIMVSMPALGLEGPWSNYISFGPGTDALGGLSSITGYKNGRPHKPGNFYADHNSGFHVATGIMAALFRRYKTGEGQHLEIVLREATMSVIGEYFIEYQFTGKEPKRIGNDHPVFYPHGIFQCKGDDSWIAISVESNQEWQTLCEVIESTELKNDNNLTEVSSRRLNREKIELEITDWTKSKSNKEAMDLMQTRGIRAGIVAKASDILSDAHVSERNYLDTVEHPDAGEYTSPGLPFKFTRSSTNLGVRAPMFSEHTLPILSDLLARDMSTIDSLIEKGTTPLEPIDRVYS